MIKRLEPEHVERDWNLINFAMGDELCPIIRVNKKEIKKAALEDLVQIWMIIDEEDKKEPNRGYVFTMISKDYLSETRTLLVLKAVAVLEVRPEIWSQGILDIINFSKKSGCSRLMALTESDHVAAFARQLGGDVRFKLLTLEV